MQNDYYMILGVSKHASKTEIIAAYNKKINDPHLTSRQKQLIIDAYLTLSDDAKRRDYDMINDNMQLRTNTVNTNNGYTRFEAKVNGEVKTIPKWKIIMWAIIIVVIALLIVAALIWGFISLLPIIVVGLLIYFIYKILKR